MSIRNLLAEAPYHKMRADLVSTPVTTAAWTEVLAATPKACTAISVFYTGDAVLKLSTGAPGQENAAELALYLTPGMDMNLMIPIEVKHGKRISIRAEDQDADVGELIINFFG